MGLPSWWLQFYQTTKHIKMKKIILASLLSLAIWCVNAQETAVSELPETEQKVAITLGVLQGGGSLLGADLEFMVAKQFSVQLGAGFVGYGAALNYHLKPSIRSSMISLNYWHQGAGETHTQTLLGPTYVFRAKKLFTAQLGLGFPLEKGPAWPSDQTHPPVMLMYSLGIYLPI